MSKNNVALSLESFDTVFSDIQYGLEYETLVQYMKDLDWNKEFAKTMKDMEDYGIVEDDANSNELKKLPNNNDSFWKTGGQTKNIRKFNQVLSYNKPTDPVYKKVVALYNRKSLTRIFNQYNRPKSDADYNKYRFRTESMSQGVLFDDDKDKKNNGNVAKKNNSKTTNEFSWIVTYDSSVGYDPNDTVVPTYLTQRYGEDGSFERCNCLDNIEIVSPPLNIKTDHETLYDIIERVLPNSDSMINRLLYFSNKTTSNHVHMTCGGRFLVPENLFKICMAWYYFEPVFMQMCGPARRDNKYCAGMRKVLDKNRLHHSLLAQMTYQKFLDDRKLTPGVEGTDAIILASIVNLFQTEGGFTRYTALNLYNVVGKIKTIECRLKECSTSAKDILAWVYLLGAFYARAICNKCVSEIYTDAQQDTLFDSYGDDTANTKSIKLFFKFLNVPSLERYWGKKIENYRLPRSSKSNNTNVKANNSNASPPSSVDEFIGSIIGPSY